MLLRADVRWIRGSMWITAIGMVVACAGPGSSGSGGQAAQQPVVKKVISAAAPGNFHTVSSLLAVSGTGTATPGIAESARLLNPGLTGVGQTADRDALLAEAVPTTDNRLWKVLPDGRMETTWHIRPNVLWHDGVPFTSDDLLFTAKLVADKDLGVPRDRRFDLVENVEAPDPRTITVTWKKPFIEADQLFGSDQYAPLPQHLLEQPFTSQRANFLEIPYFTREFVGTGAFKLGEFDPASHVTLDANDRFVLGRPKIDQIVVKFIPSPETLVANVIAGSVELVLGRSVSLQQGATLREQWHNGTVYIITADPRALTPQHQDPTPTIVKNVQFRKALSYAINREEMAQSLGAGLAPAAQVGIALEDPLYKAVQPGLVTYEYDPRKAVAMIEEIGYSRGADGVLRDSRNQPIPIGLRATEREVNIGVVLAAADYWKRIGIQADPEIVSEARVTEREWYARFPSFRTGGGGYAGLSTLDRVRPEQVP
ncbi:MAG TPA: ABC transporter substrate-binding protein, partial [Chloroflexota bacterium]